MHSTHFQISYQKKNEIKEQNTKKINNKKVQVSKEELLHLTNVLRRQLIAPAMRISRDFQVKSWENASYMT